MGDWKTYAEQGKRMVTEESNQLSSQFQQALRDGLALPKITQSAFDNISANVAGYFRARPPESLSSLEISFLPASGYEGESFENSFSATIKGSFGKIRMESTISYVPQYASAKTGEKFYNLWHPVRNFKYRQEVYIDRYAVETRVCYFKNNWTLFDKILNDRGCMDRRHELPVKPPIELFDAGGFSGEDDLIERLSGLAIEVLERAIAACRRKA